MLKLAGKYADICVINEEKQEEFLAAKDDVIRAAKAQKRPNAPSFACVIGAKTLEQKGEYRLKIERVSDLGVSHIIT